MDLNNPRHERRVEVNCSIKAFHAVLMAESLGVGSCYNHLIPGACRRSPALRAMLGLAEDREIYDSVTLGYARYRWHCTVPRQLAEVRYLE